MSGINVEAVKDFFAEKATANITREELRAAVIAALEEALQSQFGEDAAFDILVNPQTGEIEVYKTKEVVADDAVEDPAHQVPLSVAQKEDPEIEIGDEYDEEIDIAEALGRRGMQRFRNALQRKLYEVELERARRKYESRIGELVIATVIQARRDELRLLDEEGNELILPRSEMLPREFFRKDSDVKAVVKEVVVDNGRPRIILSRTDPRFLAQLFAQEVPEIQEGLIAIRKVVRQPGWKAKMTVESFDDRIDPVGSCVGIRGSRIRGIVRELRNENIDVLPHTDNIPLMIARALAPAQVSRVEIDPETKRASVYMPVDQIPLAVGREGINIKLASQLVGYEIDLYREGIQRDESIDLDAFVDEIEEWIIDDLKEIGLDTAHDVLNMDDEELAHRTELEPTTIQEVKKILRKRLAAMHSPQQ